MIKVTTYCITGEFSEKSLSDSLLGFPAICVPDILESSY